MDIFTKDFSDYVTAVFPLVISHLVIPPFSYFAGEMHPLLDLWYASLPESFKSLDLLNSLILFDYQKQQGFHSAMITSMFVHYNYDHLLSNLAGLVTTGYRVFLRGGVSTLYAVFFVGGIASDISVSEMHKKFLELFPRDTAAAKFSVRNHADSSLSSKLLSMIPDNVSKLQENILSTLQKATTATKVSMGSSGAICALMGFEYSYAIVDVIGLLRLLLREQNRLSSVTSSAAEDRLRRIQRDRFLQLLSPLWTTCSYSMSMHADWCQVQSSNQSAKFPFVPSILFTFFGSQGGNHLIGYSAHLQGFGFGVLLGLGHLSLNKYVVNRKYQL
jgi:membrane associated rhomboid family serine protease